MRGKQDRRRRCSRRRRPRRTRSSAGSCCSTSGIDLAPINELGPADREAGHLRLQRRRGRADGCRPQGGARRPRRPRPGDLPGREDRVRAHRPRPRGRRRAARLHRSGRVGPRPARPHRLRHPRPADVPDRRPEGGPRLDDPQGRQGPAGGRCDPHRLREGLHQGRGHLVRGPGRDRLRRRGPRQGQGAPGGQGLRHAGRRRGGVQVLLQGSPPAGDAPAARTAQQSSSARRARAGHGSVLVG